MISVAFALIVGLPADTNVAGSIYLNHPVLFSERDEVLGQTVRTNAEASFKLSADVSDEVSVTAKICYGCHGFEADMGYVEWAPSELISFRAGRFPVPFGEFYLRYDPASHISATKPLPYSMGRMLRREEYNLGILPEPYPDNGVQLFGTLAKESVELSYAAYAVAGLKGDSSGADLDFRLSRGVYYADNNASPAVGGRVAVAFPELPGEAWRWLAIGFSGMYGHYDPEGDLDYILGGVDFYTRISRINIRAEALFRRTAIPDRAVFAQQIEDLFVQREGFYAQVDGPMGEHLEWLFRLDGLRRNGPTLINALLTDPDSSILRYTLGANVIPTQGFKLKINYEQWRFSSFETENIVHAGVVGTF